MRYSSQDCSLGEALQPEGRLQISFPERAASALLWRNPPDKLRVNLAGAKNQQMAVKHVIDQKMRCSCDRDDSVPA